MRELQMSTLDTFETSLESMKCGCPVWPSKAIFSAWAFLDIYAQTSDGHFPPGRRGVATKVVGRFLTPRETSR